MIHVFLRLLAIDFLVFPRIFKDKLINAAIWVSCELVISGYILTAFGMDKDFGVFQAAGTFSSIVGFELYGALFNFTADLEGSRHIYYELGLPIKPILLFLQKTVSYTINNLIMLLISLPVSKLVLFYQLDLTAISFFQLMVSFVVMSWFFATFTLLLISLLGNVSSIENVIIRVMFPLWYLGGFQYSVKVAYNVAPIAGLLSLFSPYTYANEALRVALLGQSDYLPFWINISVMLAGSVAFFLVAFQRLSKKLNFVF